MYAGLETNDLPEQQTLTIQQAIDLAVKHHNAGRLPEAEKIYNQILQAEPDQPVALHLLGVIAHQVGKNDIAVELITKALAIKPYYAKAHSNLGNALKELGRLEEAVASFNRALELEPDLAVAQDNLIAVFRDYDRSRHQRVSTGSQEMPTGTEANAPGQPSDIHRKGELIIGIGTGRSGSTSLVKLLQMQSGAFISHERPPRLPWSPNFDRLRVHLSCFEHFLWTHQVVGDVSHWWLPYLNYLFKKFPTMKVIVLQRNREETIKSFERIKGVGKGSINHWSEHNGKDWSRNIWDECYPKYDLSDRYAAIGRC